MAFTDVGNVPVVHTSGGFDNGGGWMGMLLLIALLGGGRGGLFGGFGGHNGGGYETRREMEALNNTNHQFGIQKDILENRFAGANEMQKIVHAIDRCCCETNRNIDSVKFEASRNTCDIIQAGNNNTQRIVDTLTQDRFAAMSARNNELERLLSEHRLSAQIVGAIQPPRPVPAYAAANPFSVYQPTVHCHTHGGNC